MINLCAQFTCPYLSYFYMYFFNVATIIGELKMNILQSDNACIYVCGNVGCLQWSVVSAMSWAEDLVYCHDSRVDVLVVTKDKMISHVAVCRNSSSAQRTLSSYAPTPRPQRHTMSTSCSAKETYILFPVLSINAFDFNDCWWADARVNSLERYRILIQLNNNY